MRGEVVALTSKTQKSKYGGTLGIARDRIFKVTLKLTKVDKGKGKGSKGDKDGGKNKNNDPRVQKAFKLSKEGKKVCPYYQIGNCRYPGSCNFSNECYICGSTSHGAIKCPALNTERAKTRLGM